MPSLVARLLGLWKVRLGVLAAMLAALSILVTTAVIGAPSSVPVNVDGSPLITANRDELAVCMQVSDTRAFRHKRHVSRVTSALAAVDR